MKSRGVPIRWWNYLEKNPSWRPDFFETHALEFLSYIILALAFGCSNSKSFLQCQIKYFSFVFIQAFQSAKTLKHWSFEIQKRFPLNLCQFHVWMRKMIIYVELHFFVLLMCNKCNIYHFAAVSIIWLYCHEATVYTEVSWQ